MLKLTLNERKHYRVRFTFEAQTIRDKLCTHLSFVLPIAATSAFVTRHIGGDEKVIISKGVPFCKANSVHGRQLVCD